MNFLTPPYRKPQAAHAPPGSERDGFALIIAISLMAFILLLLLSLTAMVSVETQSATIAQQQSLARCNARFAAIMALGELQKLAGPDTRSTATAAILDTNPQTPVTEGVAHPHWLGVWDSDPSSGTYGEHLGWLVSRASTTTPDPLLPAPLTVTSNRATVTDTDWAMLVGLDSIRINGTQYLDEDGDSVPDDAVVAELVDIQRPEDGSPLMGRVAWWVSDESSKAKLTLQDERTAVGTDLALASSFYSPPTLGLEQFGGLDNFDLSQADRLSYLSLANAALLNLGATDNSYTSSLNEAVSLSAAFQAQFHSLSTSSLGLLTNSRSGGLRKDLTFAFENPAVYTSEIVNEGLEDIFVDAHPLYGDIRIQGGRDTLEQRVNDGYLNDERLIYEFMPTATPTLANFRDYYRLKDEIQADGTISPKVLVNDYNNGGDDATYERATHLMPVLSSVGHAFGFEVDTGLDLSGNTVINGMTFHRQNQYVFYNPYNIEIDMDALAGRSTVTDGWPGTLLDVDEGHNTKITISKVGGLTSETLYQGYGGWVVHRIGGGAENGQASLTGFHHTIDTFDNSNLSFSPGESKLFRWVEERNPDKARHLSADDADWSNGDGTISAEIRLNEWWGAFNQGWPISDGDKLVGPQMIYSGAGDGDYWTFGLGEMLEIKVHTAASQMHHYNSYNTSLDQAPMFFFGSVDSRGPYRWADRFGDTGDGFNRCYFHVSVGSNGGRPRDRGKDVITEGSDWVGGGIRSPDSPAASSEDPTLVASPNDWDGTLTLGYRLFLRDPDHDNAGGGTFRTLIDSNPRPLFVGTALDASCKSTELPTCLPYGMATADDEGDILNLVNSEDAFNYAYTENSTPLFDIPRDPLVSLAQLQHAFASPMAYMPTYPVGNSYASTWLPLDTVARDNVDPYNGVTNGTYFYRTIADSSLDGNAFVDISYLLNEHLYDQYFFSAIDPALSDSEFAAIRDSGADPSIRFLNSRYIPYQPKHTTYSAGDYVDGNQTGNFETVAGKLLIDGPFNVNSTSVEAWVAVLSSLKGRAVPILDPGAGTPSSGGADADFQQVDSGDSAYVSRFSRPTGEDFMQGYRILDTAAIHALAEAIVAENKARSIHLGNGSALGKRPFGSLSEFVNRLLIDTGNPASLDNPAALGALQAALDKTVNDVSSYFSDADGPSLDANLAIPDAEANAVGPTNAPVQAMGFPGYVLQADLLQQLDSILVTRGDTFTIRTYGDVRNDVTEVTEASAWLEMTVQRVPDPVAAAPGDDDELALPTSPFGRQFKIVSMRWLNQNEI